MRRQTLSLRVSGAEQGGEEEGLVLSVRAFMNGVPAGWLADLLLGRDSLASTV